MSCVISEREEIHRTTGGKGLFPPGFTPTNKKLKAIGDMYKIMCADRPPPLAPLEDDLSVVDEEEAASIEQGNSVVSSSIDAMDIIVEEDNNDEDNNDEDNNDEDNNDEVWEDDLFSAKQAELAALTKQLQEASNEIDELEEVNSVVSGPKRQADRPVDKKRSHKKKKIEAPAIAPAAPVVAKVAPKRKVAMTDKKMSVLRKTADLVKKSRYDRPADSDIYVLENFDLLDLSDDAIHKLDNYISQISHSVNIMANETINSMINQGLAIEKKCQLAQKANKKLSKKQIYQYLATFMKLKGSEEANARWFQRRQAIAKIKDILDLGDYSYSLSANELMTMAPQILQAHAEGLFD
jgi:hypothetical protein